MAISDVLLEQISQITNIMYSKFVNIQFVKIIYMVQDVSKVLLKNFRINKLHTCIMCLKTKLDKCMKLFPE